MTASTAVFKRSVVSRSGYLLADLFTCVTLLQLVFRRDGYATPWQVALSAVALALLVVPLWVGIRIIRARIEVDENTISVCNVFRTLSLSRSDARRLVAPRSASLEYQPQLVMASGQHVKLFAIARFKSKQLGPDKSHDRQMMALAQCLGIPLERPGPSNQGI